MLSPYRVLDCTDHRGHLAGSMLAQLGAEVILVEPPQGSPARNRPPFAGGSAETGPSLWHVAHNRGKASVVLDLRDPAAEQARQHFDALCAQADILLWSGHPAELAFDPAELQARHPALIIGLLSAFGLDGPKSHWRDSDLTVCASACQLALTGDTDRPPLRCGVPQGYAHGSGDLAVGVLYALAERGRSGRGQIVDVSAQTAYLQSSFAYALNEAWENAPLGRSGEGINVGPFMLRWGYPASDGEVSVTFLFGAAFKEFAPNLFRWAYEEGLCDEATRDKPWEDLIVRLLDGREPLEELYRLADIVAALTSRHTKAHLLDEARRRRVLMAPVATLAEVMELDHLQERQLWERQAVLPGGDPLRQVGRFIVASGTPLVERGPAPALGADTERILSGLGAVALNRSHEASAFTSGAGDAALLDARPLDGLKVLDLTWSIAGPYVGRGLADFGATVVKVETQQRVDVTRTVMPLHPLNAQHPMECGGLFANSNAGKLGIELDLGTDAGREVLWDLLRWADVVLESFSAGAFERMGFGYDAIKAVNPSVILLSSCLPGQTGSLNLPGYGNLASALFGFHWTTRWPDRPAAGPFGAYTDTVSPRFSLSALLAAIDHRRRTGEGQYLDLSQAEASLQFLAPALLDVEVNGNEYVSLGNGDVAMAPHGVYPVQGQDRWVAVVCDTDTAWSALAHAAGRADLAGLGTSERLARRQELDEVVAAWTATLPFEDADARLQALGVAAHNVTNSAECLADPQLAHRGHYVTVTHPFIGPVLVEGPRAQLSRTPGRITGPGPRYGEHAFDILSGLLGYDEDRIADVAAAGALG